MRDRIENRGGVPNWPGWPSWCWRWAWRRPCPLACQAEETAGKEWIGQRVVPKQREFKLQGRRRRARTSGQIAIYRVDQVKGNSLALTPDGGSVGWADAGQVVPIDQGVEFFSDAIAKSPRDPHNYAMRAMILLLEREDAEHALADCEQAIRLDPRFAFARGIRGAARAASQDLDKAIADFSEVIRLTPNEPAAYRDRGVVRMSNRDFDGAIADFNEAIRLDPKDSPTFVSRATAWLSKKRRRQGDGRLRRGHPPRSEDMPMPSCCGPRSAARSGNSTRPSPTSPRSSSSIPRRPWLTRLAAPDGGT